MKISVFGLGYVGCVSVGCLAQNGHEVIGVDINKSKVDLINDGKPTIIEKDIDKLIAENFIKGRITATQDYRKALIDTQVSLLCVGTPSLPTGQLNLAYVYNTAKQIGDVLKDITRFYVIVIRSTVLPGTNHEIGVLIEKYSGKKRNIDFAVVSNPEFLREGTAVEDYYNPEITILGTENKKALEIMKEVYNNIEAPIISTDIKAAEMIKYVNNSFHALKISFANEVGNICKSIGVDSYKVMELFKMDKRLNISTAYLNPGMAYGGSCLPKDLKGLSTIAHDNYVESPILNAIEPSNQLQKNRVFSIIEKYGEKRIGILGLAFKKGTDDLRYSPTVELVESLIGKGYEVIIYDKNVTLSKLTGVNKDYIESHLPHISGLLITNILALKEKADLIIVNHKPELDEMNALKEFKGRILDLVRIDDLAKQSNLIYEGLCW